MYEYFSKSVITTVVSIFLFVTPLIAQNKTKIDSLKLVLEKATGKSKWDAQFSIVRFYFDRTDYSEALKYSIEASKTAQSLNDTLLMVKSGRTIAYMKMKMDDLDGAIEGFNYYLNMADRNSLAEESKYILNNLAIAYTYTANYDKALECHLKNLVLIEKSEDTNSISMVYNNIGLVYFKLKDWSKALEFFKQSESIKRKNKSYNNLDRCLSNIGLCYIKLFNYSEAIRYFNEAISLCSSNANCDDHVLTESRYGLGVAFYETGEMDKAKEQAIISYQKALNINNSVFQGENLLLLSAVYDAQQLYDSSFYYLSKAEDLLYTTHYNELKVSLYGAFSNYFDRIGDFENAAKYQKKYIQVKDSIYSEELIRNLATVQTNYEERENLATIALKDEALLRQKRFNIAIITIAVLAATLVFVLYRSNQVKQRVNKALSNAKATIEDQNRQLTTLNRNLEKMVDARTMELQIVNESLKRVNDELDNFIYKTSHDIRGPLASLKGICNVAMMDVSDPLALDYFMKLDATAEKLNTILTRLLIINQINNSAAGNEMIDFSEIVEDVIMLERKRGLPPNLNITKDIQDGIIFYSDKELVRIILENLIDNAIKFYNDSDRISPFVHIKVVSDDGFLTISVIDNGIGISQVNPDKIFQMFSRASERSGTGGIGLYLTKTATEKIGGQIDLKTTPEGYTEFFVRFSLNATNKIRAKVTV